MNISGAPTLRLASANVTSLSAVWDLITELPFDLLAVQELRVTNVAHWQKEASRAGLSLN